MSWVWDEASATVTAHTVHETCRRKPRQAVDPPLNGRGKTFPATIASERFEMRRLVQSRRRPLSATPAAGFVERIAKEFAASACNSFATDQS